MDFCFEFFVLMIWIFIFYLRYVNLFMYNFFYIYKCEEKRFFIIVVYIYILFLNFLYIFDIFLIKIMRVSE